MSFICIIVVFLVFVEADNFVFSLKEK